MAVKGIQEINIKDKGVFFRFDFNVPLDSSGEVGDDTRLRRALPTLRYAKEQGARCILASHLGRPKGESRPELTLRPVASKLSQLLDVPVNFVPDCIGKEVSAAVGRLSSGELLLLENLRFYPGETKNDPTFAGQLADLAEVYVNDAFGTAHRAHASTVGVPTLLTQKAAGFLMKEELDNLGRALENPVRPVVALFGGAKVSDKLAILSHFVRTLDSVLIGGGMANTFLRAKGLAVGASRVEDDMLETAHEILQEAQKAGCRVLLPQDVVVATSIENPGRVSTVGVTAIPSDSMALDIGPQTIQEFTREIQRAATLIWNGPMGVFEEDAFAKGTNDIAQAVAASEAFSLVGGGDTIRAVRKAGIESQVSYISTGGGAFMEFLEGKKLPGIEALEC
jgi:phosphoglycerate kinase